jgi:acyl dehydratase
VAHPQFLLQSNLQGQHPRTKEFWPGASIHSSLHIDSAAAKGSECGRILVNGTFTFALIVGLSVGDTTLSTLVANLGYDKLMMPKPVFIGDTLRAESEVVELRESRSRPDAGIITFAHRLRNQRNEIVSQCRTFEVPQITRPAVFNNARDLLAGLPFEGG